MIFEIASIPNLVVSVSLGVIVASDHLVVNQLKLILGLKTI